MKFSNKNIDYYTTSNIGNTKVEVYVEKLESVNNIEKYEFIFKVDDSTSNNNKISIIKDLYNLFLLVQKTLLEYIDNNIIAKINDNNIIQLIIEPEGINESEVVNKDKLYNYHLDRLVKNYNKTLDNIFCTHSKEGIRHIISFSRC